MIVINEQQKHKKIQKKFLDTDVNFASTLYVDDEPDGC